MARYDVVHVRSRIHLRKVLAAFHVPVDRWTPAEFAELHNQIKDGETRLVVIDQKKLVRLVHRAQLLIFSRVPGHPHRFEFLKEGEQTFDGGNKRKRRRDISLSEKRKRGVESFKDAGVRGAREELRDPNNPAFRVHLRREDLIFLKKFRTRARQSRTFRGLSTCSTITQFGCLIRPCQRIDRYVEYDNGKTSTATWTPWPGKLPFSVSKKKMAEALE